MILGFLFQRMTYAVETVAVRREFSTPDPPTRRDSRPRRKAETLGVSTAKDVT